MLPFHFRSWIVFCSFSSTIWFQYQPPFQLFIDGVSHSGFLFFHGASFFWCFSSVCRCFRHFLSSTSFLPSYWCVPECFEFHSSCGFAKSHPPSFSLVKNGARLVVEISAASMLLKLLIILYITAFNICFSIDQRGKLHFDICRTW